MQSNSNDRLRKLQKDLEKIRRKSNDIKYHRDTDNIETDCKGYSNEN